jgi:hypothetical protein
MPLIQIVIVLIVIGVLLWLVNLIPMQRDAKFSDFVAIGFSTAVPAMPIVP